MSLSQTKTSLSTARCVNARSPRAYPRSSASPRMKPCCMCASRQGVWTCAMHIVRNRIESHHVHTGAVPREPGATTCALDAPLTASSPTTLPRPVQRASGPGAAQLTRRPRRPCASGASRRRGGLCRCQVSTGWQARAPRPRHTPCAAPPSPRGGGRASPSPSRTPT